MMQSEAYLGNSVFNLVVLIAFSLLLCGDQGCSTMEVKTFFTSMVQLKGGASCTPLGSAQSLKQYD